MWCCSPRSSAALGYVLWRARTALGLATREAGLSRLEQDSGIPHQPLRALDDSLPGDFKDPATQRLWALHRQRLIDSLGRLRLSPPRSDLPRRDPWALRSALLLVLLLALVHARGEIAPRLGSAFQFGGRTAQASLPPMVDLWVTPPAYTRRAPLVSEQTRGVQALAVPTGSEARAQVHHLPEDVTAEIVYGEATSQLKPLGPGSAEASLALDRDAFLSVRDASGQEIAGWLIDVVPDAVPTVSFVGEPRATHRSVLKIDLEAADDYGVAELALLLAPPGGEGEAERLTLLKPGNQPPKVATGTYPGPDRAPAGRPAGHAAARGGRRDRAARPERAAGDHAAGARVPPSAGARDHRAAAQARGDARRQQRGGGQPRGTGRHAGGPAAADGRAADACGSRRHGWR